MKKSLEFITYQQYVYLFCWFVFFSFFDIIFLPFSFLSFNLVLISESLSLVTVLYRNFCLFVCFFFLFPFIYLFIWFFFFFLFYFFSFLHFFPLSDLSLANLPVFSRWLTCLLSCILNTYLCNFSVR